MEVIGYTRVSTREQAQGGHSLTTQRRAIEAECERRGWTLVEIIEDAGYTGTTDDRPGLRRALTMLKRRQARALVVARMDRLARSTQHLCEFITVSKKQKWSMVALDMGLDTTTPNGRMVVRILAAVAEWESEMNSERVKDGMAEARANGKQFGFRRQAPEAVVTRILHERNNGASFNAIARGLDADHTPTPNGGARWYGSTVARLHRAATNPDKETAA
jgi:DNA invertase Pin-like site-specific DNA recombinase